MDKKQFIIRLYSTGMLQFGEFTLKSGISSPFYINLRQIVSYPDMLEGLAELAFEHFPQLRTYQLFAGVPYAGIPIATALSMRAGKPMIIPRKEEKSYGSKDAIIGSFSSGDSVLLIEDIITSGESILETKETLEVCGLKTTGAFVVIDRRAAPYDFKQKHGIELLPLFSIQEIISVLIGEGYLSLDMSSKIEAFLQSSALPKMTQHITDVNLLTTRLRNAIEEKKTNVVLSLDVSSPDEFMRILKLVSDEICMVKTHIDILENFSRQFIGELTSLCLHKNILLFEDRKFADIGNTVRMQYRGGIYKIAEWADFVTVHLLPGETILDGLFGGLENKSSFLLAKMSAKGNLMSENYMRSVIEIGKKRRECVSGFIGHGTSIEDIQKIRKKIPEDLLLLMPGVQLQEKGDSLGQTYITPQMAIQGGADCIIVGRGITHAEDPRAAAGMYRHEAWKARSN